MSSSSKITHFILGISIISMGVFAWIYDDVIANGRILSPLFVAYGIWRLYRGYITK